MVPRPQLRIWRPWWPSATLRGPPDPSLSPRDNFPPSEKPVHTHASFLHARTPPCNLGKDHFLAFVLIVNGRSPCAIPKGFSFSKSTMRYNRQLKSLHTLVVYYSLKRLLRKFYIQNVIFVCSIPGCKRDFRLGRNGWSVMRIPF